MKFSKQQLMEAAEQIAANYRYPHPNHDDAEKRITHKFFKTLMSIARHMDQNVSHNHIIIHKENQDFSAIISNLAQFNYIFPDDFRLKIQDEKSVKHTKKYHLLNQWDTADYASNLSEEDSSYDDLMEHVLDNTIQQPIDVHEDLSEGESSHEDLDVTIETLLSGIPHDSTSENSSDDTETLTKFSCKPFPIPPRPGSSMLFRSVGAPKSFINPFEENYLFFLPENPLLQQKMIQKKLAQFSIFPKPAELLKKPNLQEEFCLTSDTPEDSSLESPANLDLMPVKKVELTDKLNKAFREFPSKHTVFLCGGAIVDLLLHQNQSRDIDFILLLNDIKHLDLPDSYIKDPFKNNMYCKKDLVLPIDVKVIPGAEKNNKSWMSNDIKNRDFTVCKLYSDADGNIYDPEGKGLNDLYAGILSLGGNEAYKLKESPLRIIRAFKYVDRFKPDEALDNALRSFTGLDPRKKEYFYLVTKIVLEHSSPEKKDAFLCFLKEYGLTKVLFDLDDSCDMGMLFNKISTRPTEESAPQAPDLTEDAMFQSAISNISR